ncbi:MAG: hypothetical protein HC803_01750 [Saprospiraceae bacterium]|nr:hypothetical protein [Saprospiraceae bacterium]
MQRIDTLAVFDDLRNLDSIVYMSDKILATEAAFDTLTNQMIIFINTDSAYQAMKQRAINNGCSTCVFPNIDFTNRTLIGRYFDIGCNDIAQQRFVETSDSTYAFYNKFININQCAFSTCLNSTFNWVLVPKVDAVEQIEFFYGQFYYECDC